MQEGKQEGRREERKRGIRSNATEAVLALGVTTVRNIVGGTSQNTPEHAHVIFVQQGAIPRHVYLSVGAIPIISIPSP